MSETLFFIIVVGWPVPGLVVLILYGWSLHRKDMGKHGFGSLLRRASLGTLGLVCNVPRLRAACVDFARDARADLAGMWAALRREP